MNIYRGLFLPLLNISTAVLLYVLSSHSLAVTLTEVATLTVSDNDLGIYPLVDEDTIVVNASGNKLAYVFTRTDDVWSEQAILTSSDDGANPSTFSLGGETVVFGEYYTAYTFVRSNKIWIEEGILEPFGGYYNDLFGWSVSTDGDTIVVGMILDDAPGDDSSVYVYLRDDGDLIDHAVLKPSGSTGEDQGEQYFGQSIAVDGDTIVVGGGYDWDNHLRMAYVFTRTDDIWNEQAKLTPSVNDDELRYGYTVHLDNDIALVGIPGRIYSTDDWTGGRAHIYKRTDGVWVEEAILRPRAFDGDDKFTSFSVSGDFVVIGSIPVNKLKHPGSAHVFVRNNGIWSKQATLIPSDLDVNDRFGGSISVSDDTVVVGAIDRNEGGVTRGSAYIFTLPDIVSIDIKPSKKTENIISLNKGKNLKVVIIGSSDIDALQVNPATVKFGPSEANPIRHKGKDYNKDGFSDLILTFKLDETGISCGDVEATLTGQTFPEPVINIAGSDTFTVEPCP